MKDLKLGQKFLLQGNDKQFIGYLESIYLKPFDKIEYGIVEKIDYFYSPTERMIFTKDELLKYIIKELE